MELGSRHNQGVLARKAIREGISIEDFRGQLLNSLPTDEPLETKEIGLTDKESRSFSILKAVNAMANPSDRRAQEAAKFEFECSDAAKDKYGRNSQGSNTSIRSDAAIGKRVDDINTTNDSGRCW